MLLWVTLSRNFSVFFIISVMRWLCVSPGSPVAVSNSSKYATSCWPCKHHHFLSAIISTLLPVPLPTICLFCFSTPRIDLGIHPRYPVNDLYSETYTVFVEAKPVAQCLIRNFDSDLVWKIDTFVCCYRYLSRDTAAVGEGVTFNMVPSSYHFVSIKPLNSSS